ncbi:MAG: L-seryl-tRNA(Sec) selenium transferase [Nitrospirae bacterium]|nr:L-seryl-tRNA(Sec) selenium transferase [Nitrospirota bacterium]
MTRAEENPLRTLPQVETLANEVLESYPALLKSVAVDVAREVIEDARTQLRKGRNGLTEGVLLRRAGDHVRNLLSGGLRPVINATGIIIHTNLGRAPLSAEAVQEVVQTAGSYSNLEFDLTRGERGERINAVRSLLHAVCGGEDSLVVNNNAAAVLLVLAALAKGKEVVVSRGELVEIGGSFRVPEVMEQSGAILREVGTTNKTRLKDYEQAISPATALMMKAHRSNFQVVGFTEETSLEELVELGRKKNVPVYMDLGSGAVQPFTFPGVSRREPLVREIVSQGTDLVSFSGDKMLGGPQAGIIIGTSKLIQQIAHHPLYRALRPDKMTLAALAGTLRLCLTGGEAASQIPVTAMLNAPLDELRRHAEQVRRTVLKSRKDLDLEIVEDTSYAGGGALPMEALPTLALHLKHPSLSPNSISDALRISDPPVIGRISDNRFLLDLRTVFPREIPDLARAIIALS